MPATALQPTLASLRPPDSGKIVAAEEAVSLIRDGDTIATGGFVGIGFAEEIAVALERLYLSKEEQPANGKLRNLTLVYAAGQGDGKERGLNHLGHEGLVRRVIGGHRGLVPSLQQRLSAHQIGRCTEPARRGAAYLRERRRGTRSPARAAAQERRLTGNGTGA